jgi:Tfp pilus assembly protein PilF
MHARTSSGLRPVLIASALLVGAAFLPACAPKTVLPPATSVPKFPDFVYPAVPEGVGTAATIERHKAGWQWLQAGDLRAADRNFNAALKLSADFYPAEAGLGYSALARREHEPALQHFDRAVVLNPRYAPALVGRGDALLAIGQRDMALKSFEAAVSANPDLAALRSRIEVLRVRGLQEDVAAARKAAEAGKLPEARKAYEQAISASPESPFLYRELAIVEQKDGDLAAALGHAQKASELEPGEARDLILIGEILEGRGDVNGAIESYRAAAAIDPDPALDERIERLREHAALEAMPPEFKTIDSSPTLTRAQLAALIGVRLDPLLRRAAQRNPGVITDARTTWAATWVLNVARAGVMEVYPNHTFQPNAMIRRADLARAASNVLSLIAAERPALASAWKDASKRRFQDVSQGNLSYGAVSLVVEAGVMDVTPDGNFQLTRPATGAEAVAAVTRLEELAGSRAR